MTVFAQPMPLNNAVPKVTQQPYGILPLNYANKFARDCIYSCYNFGAEASLPPRDAVTGAGGTRAGTGVRMAGGTIGNSAIFSAASSDSSLTNNAPNLAPFHTYTFAWWWYWDVFANDDGVLFESSNSFSANVGAFLFLPGDSTSGKMVFAVLDSGFNTVIIGWDRPSGAQWHHCAIAIDCAPGGGNVNALIKMYVDGVYVPITTQRGGTWGAGANLAAWQINFFARAQSSLRGSGRIQHFGIFKRNYTQPEVNSLMRFPMQMFRTPTTGAYRAPTSSYPAWLAMPTGWLS